MFGANARVTSKDYADLPTGSIKRTTSFYTSQGEAFNSGTTCVFVRFTGCDLNCRFCDTYFDKGEVLTFSESYREIHNEYSEFFLKRGLPIRPMPVEMLIVLTGGEPLLQPNFTDYVRYLLRRGHRVQVETNGTHYSEVLRGIEVMCSPKINESTRKPIRPHPEVLKMFSDFKFLGSEPFIRKEFKFVISSNVEGYTDIPEWAKEWAGDSVGKWNRIWLSPMNMYNKEPQKIGPDGSMAERVEKDERISYWTKDLLNLEQNQANHERVAELQLRYGCRSTVQSHLLLNIP